MPKKPFQRQVYLPYRFTFFNKLGICVKIICFSGCFSLVGYSIFHALDIFSAENRLFSRSTVARLRINSYFCNLI